MRFWVLGDIRTVRGVPYRFCQRIVVTVTLQYALGGIGIDAKPITRIALRTINRAAVRSALLCTWWKGDRARGSRRPTRMVCA